MPVRPPPIVRIWGGEELTTLFGYRKAAKIFQSFVSSTGGMDRVIPTSVLRRAHGFAIFSVVKGGAHLRSSAFTDSQ